MEPEVESDFTPKGRDDAFYVCCISCGATSPGLYTDFGIRYWVRVHPCSVSPELRQWFTTDMGEEVGD